MSNKNHTFITSWANKIRGINLLGGKCITCREDNIFVMDFHHLDNNKECNVNVIKNHRYSNIFKEINKCSLLCGNCHADLHYERGFKNERTVRLKQKMFDVLDIYQCERCRYKGIRSLVFHHKTRSDKVFEISSGITAGSGHKRLEELLKEVKKCEVLCRNCHKKEHADIERFNIFKDQIFAKVSKYKERNIIDRDEVIKLHNEGFRNIDIAEKLNCAKSSITYLIQKYT